MTDRFLAEPTTHPRLRRPDAVDALREQWRSTGVARIEDALAPGLLARVATVIPQLPVEPRATDDDREVTWASHIEMPAITGLNYPSALYRVVRLLRDDLPPLLEAITAERLSVGSPFAIRVCTLRMGSFIDAHTDHPELFIWLIAPGWPATWGGQVEITDDRGAVIASLAPRAGAIDLLGPGRFRISLVERGVSCVALRYSLHPAEAT